jgi:hypothetical protein
MGKPIPRNAPCPCGSGKKYKHCCIDKGPDPVGRKKQLIIRILAIAGAVLIATVLMWIWQGVTMGLTAGGGVALFGIIVAVIINPPPSSPGGGSPDSIDFGR